MTPPIDPADGAATDGELTDGVLADGTWTEGVEADGVGPAGVWTDGTWTDGTWTEGVDTLGTWTDGTDGTEGVGTLGVGTPGRSATPAGAPTPSNVAASTPPTVKERRLKFSALPHRAFPRAERHKPPVRGLTWPVPAMAGRMAGSADENRPIDPYNIGMPAAPTSDRRDLRLLAGAVGLSATGDMLAMVALSVRVHDLTGSALAVGALYATTFVPLVLLAPLAGMLADRVESVRLLAIASVTQAAVAVALAFSGGLPALLGLSFLLAAGAAVSQPAEFSLVPVVARGRTTEANGLMESARYAGFALGPVLAGLLTAGAGTRVALLVNAGSFLAIGGAAALMRARRRPQHDGAGPGRARDGLVHLARDPVLAVTVSAAVAGLMFMSMSLTAYVFYAKDVLEVGDAGYAMLFAVWMAAMAAGATGVARRAPSHLLACGALTALAVQGAGVALQACFAVMPVALAGFAVGGAGHGIKNTLLRSLIQERVPPAVHGRAFAAYNGARNAAELGALAAGGMLVAAVGPRTALVVAGLGPVLAGTGGLTALVRRQTVPRPALQ